MSMNRLAATAAIVLLSAGSLLAGISKEMVQWRKGPAQFLLTPEEIRQWDSLRNDADAKAFIDLFWARRDPTPATPVNEFKQIFDSRVEYADLHFSYGKTRGAVTDRGKFAILLGLPTSITRSGSAVGSDILTPTPAAGGASLDEALAAANRSERTVRAETWVYEKRSDERNRVPAFAPQHTLTIPFVDQMSTGEYRVGRSPDTNVDELPKLAVQAALVNPGLTAVPDFATAKAPAPVADGSLKSEALIAALDAFKAAPESPWKDTYVSYGSYITSAGTYYVPVQIYLPKPGSLTAADKVTFFGRVEDETGTVVKTYELPASLQASRAALFADKSIDLAAGKYKGYFGLAGPDGKPVTISRTDLDLKPLSKDEPGISPLLLSDNIYPLSAAQEPTAPFSFGGMKVVVKGDRAFTKQDELWLFFELRNPGVDEAGAPKVQMKMDLEGTAAGKKVRMGQPVQDAGAEPLKGVAGHYVVGRAIPLASFKAGDYTMKVKVTDQVRNVSYDIQESFRIVE